MYIYLLCVHRIEVKEGIPYRESKGCGMQAFGAKKGALEGCNRGIWKEVKEEFFEE